MKISVKILYVKTFSHTHFGVSKLYRPFSSDLRSHVVNWWNLSSNQILVLFLRKLIITSYKQNEKHPSTPRDVDHTGRRLGHNVIQVNQPQIFNCTTIHEWYRSSWSNAHGRWRWLLLSQGMEVHHLVFCEHQHSECLHFVLPRLQQGKPKRSMLILTFDLRLQWDWWLDFQLEKGRKKPHCILGLWQLQMK